MYLNLSLYHCSGVPETLRVTRQEEGFLSLNLSDLLRIGNDTKFQGVTKIGIQTYLL